VGLGDRSKREKVFLEISRLDAGKAPTISSDIDNACNLWIPLSQNCGKICWCTGLS